MRVALLLLVAVSAVSCLKELDTEWENWKIVNKREYADGEEQLRRAIWEDNLVMILTHNSKMSSYTLKMNKFGDLTHSEFVSKYLTKTAIPVSEGERKIFTPKATTLDDTVDWRTRGYVTEIKYQGQCSSSWAFSATGSLEGQYFKRTGTLVSFSEQQLVDCSKNGGNTGCYGGYTDSAFYYINQYGIEKESDYNYTSHDESCQYNASKVVTKISGLTSVKPGSVDDMKAAVGTIGPISAAMDANHPSFKFYDHGIMDPSECATEYDQLNHEALVIGYGTTPMNYWLMKNSWGKHWGLQGYFKIVRDNNKCGVCTNSFFPTI